MSRWVLWPKPTKNCWRKCKRTKKKRAARFSPTSSRWRLSKDSVTALKTCSDPSLARTWKTRAFKTSNSKFSTLKSSSRTLKTIHVTWRVCNIIARCRYVPSHQVLAVNVVTDLILAGLACLDALEVRAALFVATEERVCGHEDSNWRARWDSRLQQELQTVCTYTLIKWRECCVISTNQLLTETQNECPIQPAVEFVA